MIKRTVKYKDLDGNEVSEDLYFHFTKAELIEMEIEKDLSGKFEKIVKGKADSKEAIFLIKDFIMDSIGKREDNKFIKSEKIRNEFIQTEAYSTLLIELVSDPAGAAVFINSLMPSDLAEVVAEVQKKAEGTTVTELPKDDKPWITENREPTSAELQSMSRADLMEAMRKKNQG